MTTEPRPTGFDVADWFDADGTAEDLRARIAATPPLEPSAERRSPTAGVVGPSLVVTSLADVQPKPVDWLWHRWLARRKLHILGGHPGDGKSTLLAALAGEFSAAGALPDGTRAPLARWLFLLAEDAIDDTLRPRLDAHGADPVNVFAIEAVREADGRDRLFNLAHHLALLEEKIAEIGIDVVVIDPVTSFMPRSDRNAEGDVRDTLTPLGKLAERTGVAVIAVMHVGKPNGTGRRPLQQLLGATAFGAIARVVWMVALVPDEEARTRRILGVVKSNLSIKPPALEWSRAEDGPIVWHGPSKHNLDNLLGGAQATPRADAEGFLIDLLNGRSQPAKTVLAGAEAAGISEKTLRRAADALSVEQCKQPGVQNGPWLWKLPNGNVSTDNGPAERPKMATPEDGHSTIFDSSLESGKVATPATNGHLPTEGTTGEDGHPAIFRGGHLPNGVRSGNGQGADPTVLATARAIAALPAEDLAAYHADLATAPPDDPNLAHDRAALALAEAWKRASE